MTDRTRDTESRAAEIAVAIPCYNEARTIGKVVADFRTELPDAPIHVFDNNSSDGSGEIAARAGATVHFVPGRGKGEVVRAMFRRIDADIVVMVDGDDTYPASRVHDVVAPILGDAAEMVVATRFEEHAQSSIRALHVFGNRLVLHSINTLFGTRLSDVLSGYRAFSRRFFKTMPVLSRGFEIETEITIHALEHRLHIVEVPVRYGSRPDGSSSKIDTLADGQLILTALLRLYKDLRPLMFFGLPGIILVLAGAVAGALVVGEFVELGRVAGIARAIFSVACCLLGTVALATGFVLDTVNRRARELYVLLADHVVDLRDTRQR